MISVLVGLGAVFAAGAVFACGAVCGAWAQHRVHVHRHGEQEDLALAVDVLHESSDRLYDDLFDAGRLLAEKDETIRRLTPPHGNQLPMWGPLKEGT